MDANKLTEYNEMYKIILDKDDELAYEFVDNKYHSFNGKVIIPVMSIEKSINIQHQNDIDILDPNQNRVARLCPLAYNDNKHLLSSLNEERLFSFFSDEQSNSSQVEFTFSHHYIVVEPGCYDYYKGIMETSECWGGFTHKTLNISSSRILDKITVIENIKYPTSNHKDSIVLAIHSYSTFERFLKYYHQVELLFDALFISKLKKINTTDLKDYSNIMKLFKSNGKSELDSLRYIINSYLQNYDKVIEKMQLITPHTQLAFEMFHALGKESNPLKSEDDWNALVQLLLTSSLNKDTCSSYNLSSEIKVKLIKNNNHESFRKLIVDLASYWIYRMRCSIAHNKIGEYVFSYSEEKFISEFGEHLLTSIVKDIFSNQRLQDDLGI